MGFQTALVKSIKTRGEGSKKVGIVEQAVVPAYFDGYECKRSSSIRRLRKRENVMAFIDFTEKLSVRVTVIDDQHKKLIAIINDLHDGMAAGKGKIIIDDVLLRLVDYTNMHFSTEEHLMPQYNYPGKNAHEIQHIDLITQVGQLYAKVIEGKVSVTLDTMVFLKDWLNHHIPETDKKMGAFLADKGVK